MSLLDLNSPRASTGIVRQPTCAVTVNGVALTGVIEVEVTNASHFTADSFHVVCASSGLPSSYGPTYWALSVGDQIAVSVSFPGASATQLILGQVDGVEFDPINGTLTLSGRDLSAPMIDARTSEKFVNLTSSQIAQQLALRHGLDSVVTATATKAGSYYDIDNVVLTQEQTEWDLLVYLAGQEGFDCWVSGNQLYFQPPPVSASVPYKMIYQGAGSGGLSSNAIDIKLGRSQTLAKDVIVKVQSWNQQQQKSFTVTYHVSQAFKGQRSGGQSQTYSFTVPNLSRDQALKLAQAKAEEITRHERVLTARLPGDNVLSTRSMVQLVGTNTAWDQNYYPDTVTRTLSVENGYRMELRAKNHSTQSTVVLG